MTDYEIMQSERLRGKGVKFERIRRITGYLVGTLDRFNSGKRAEESERVKHDVSNLASLEAYTDSILDNPVEVKTVDIINDKITA